MAEHTERGIDFAALMVKLRRGEMRLEDLTDEAVARLCTMFETTKEKLQARFDEGLERERNSPAPGRKAPDFHLERLDATGKRSGTYVRLYDKLDKPVGLVFGSYT